MAAAGAWFESRPVGSTSSDLCFPSLGRRSPLGAVRRRRRLRRSMLCAMRPRRLFSGAPTAGVAAAGVMVGHWLAYSVAFPQPQVRQAILIASGHGYWQTAVRLVVVLAVAALGVVVFRLIGDRDAIEADRTLAFATLVRRLILLQVAGFSAMEISERVVAGAPVTPMFSHALFAIGLLVQVVVAIVGALVLLSFARTVVATLRILRRPIARRLPTTHIALLAAPAVPSRALLGPASPRGPPTGPQTVTRPRTDDLAA